MSRFAVFACLFGLLGSCQSTPSRPPQDWPSRPFAESEQGLAVIVDPYFDRERIREEFGATCEKSGVFPVRVAVLNQTGSAQILDTQQIALVSEGGDLGPGQSVGTPELNKGNMAARGALAMGLVGLFVGPLLEGGMARVEATQADARMSRAALRGQTLDPGDQMSGFVYFFLEGRAPTPASGFSVRFKFVRPGESTPVTILTTL